MESIRNEVISDSSNSLGHLHFLYTALSFKSVFEQDYSMSLLKIVTFYFLLLRLYGLGHETERRLKYYQVYYDEHFRSSFEFY